MAKVQKGDENSRLSGDSARRKPKMTIAQRMSKMKAWQLLLSLAIIVTCVILFAGAVAGWFDNGKVVLDAECYCGEECDGEYIDIDAAGYERLISEKKSFILLVDQGGCKTADKVRGYMKSYAEEIGVVVYRMMFDEMKATSLHDNVKYYPSVTIVSKGKPVAWLRADEDEDAEEYNDYDSFREWIRKYLSESR